MSAEPLPAAKKTYKAGHLYVQFFLAVTQQGSVRDNRRRITYRPAPHATGDWKRDHIHMYHDDSASPVGVVYAEAEPDEAKPYTLVVGYKGASYEVGAASKFDSVSQMLDWLWNHVLATMALDDCAPDVMPGDASVSLDLPPDPEYADGW